MMIRHRHDRLMDKPWDASDATPLRKGQERHLEQTARITSQKRPAGELCLLAGDQFVNNL